MLCSDGGVMVSIVAFQAVDPGSIPGHRTLFLLKLCAFFKNIAVVLSSNFNSTFFLNSFDFKEVWQFFMVIFVMDLIRREDSKSRPPYRLQ